MNRPAWAQGRRRRGHVVVVLAAAWSLAGCFGSAPPPGGTEPPASDSARPGNPAAACAEIRTLGRVNAQFSASGNDLVRAKALLGTLVGTAARFVADAPGTVVADARIYHRDAVLLAAATAKAKSVQDLDNRARSDTKLSGAASEFGATSKRIARWSTAHC